MKSEIDFITETLEFNEMPPAARAWLIARRAKLQSEAASSGSSKP